MRPRKINRVLRVGSLTIAALFLLCVVGSLLTYKTMVIRVCPISGSTWTTTTWFGIFHREDHVTSALETWLEVRDPSFQPHWQHLATDGWQFLGRSFACSKAPAIYELCPFLTEAVRLLSEERLLGLVETLEKGSMEEQRAAVRVVCDDVIESWRRDPG